MDLEKFVILDNKLMFHIHLNTHVNNLLQNSFLTLSKYVYYV